MNMISSDQLNLSVITNFWTTPDPWVEAAHRSLPTQSVQWRRASRMRRTNDQFSRESNESFVSGAYCRRFDASLFIFNQLLNRGDILPISVRK